MQQTPRIVYFILFASFLLLSVSGMLYAQLGEVAGQPFFNVSIGSSKSLTVTIINEGSSPLPFKVILPTLNTIVNTTQPIVTANPMSGVIPAGSSMAINVTVQMPYDKRNVGHTWTGILQVVEMSNTTSSGGMGAVIIAGVAKIITIYASEPVFNPIPYIIGGIVAIVVVAGGTLYYYYRKRAAAKAKKELRAKELAELTDRARGKARKAVKKKARAKPEAKAKARKAKARRRAR